MTSVDFAAAQARIAERRRKQAHDIYVRRQAREQQLDSGALTRLPASLRQFCISAWAQWDAISSRGGTHPAFRVGQVDAELLDEEMLELFKGQVDEATKYYGQHLRSDWHSEIQLALRTILFKLTIWDHDASYGASLQNLRYTDARTINGKGGSEPAQRWQKALYGLVSVGGRYAWSKWNDHLLDVEGGYDEPSPRMILVSRLSALASTTHSVAAFLSFLIFLTNGKYRTLLDRVLRLRLTPTTSQVSREVSFEYLNRQLVWHAFTEFLLFILPLVGISRWRRWVARAWRKAKSVFRSDATGDDDDARVGGELGFLPERTCAVCYQDQNPTSASENEIAAISAASSGIVGSAATDVTNPYQAIPCGCKYCFVCIAQKLEAEDGEGWTCLRCGELIKECKAWDGDILIEETSRVASSSNSPSKSTKRVSFLDEHDQERTDESFQTLEPMPLDDEGLAGVNADILQEVDQRMGSSLDDSAEWSRVGVDVTPSDEGTEDDDQQALARQALDLGDEADA